jgi:hypothetical protein
MSCGPVIRITQDNAWRVCSDGSVRAVGQVAASEIADGVRLTEDGQWRLTESGGVRVIESYSLPEADIAALIDLYFPGIVVQRNLTEAVAEYLAVYGGVLSEADVPVILARANVLLHDDVVAPYVPTTQDDYPECPPPYPTGLPRFPDSNPATDGWSVVTDGKVVQAGGP